MPSPPLASAKDANATIESYPESHPPVFTLFLCLLSPPFLSFRGGICKVRKSYQISVWNAETHHLMHKVGRVTIIVVWNVETHHLMHKVGRATMIVVWNAETHHLMHKVGRATMIVVWNAETHHLMHKVGRVTIIVVQVVVEACLACGSQEKRNNGMKLNLPPKFSLCSQLFRFVKFSFPVTHLMPPIIMQKLAILSPLITWLYGYNSNVMKLCDDMNAPPPPPLSHNEWCVQFDFWKLTLEKIKFWEFW